MYAPLTDWPIKIIAISYWLTNRFEQVYLNISDFMFSDSSDI